MLAMSIVLIRHGETEGNASRVLQVADMPLSELGLRQARLLARRIATLGVGHLLSSTLERALMTSEAIASEVGIEIEVSPLLQERSFGDLRGTPYAALAVDPFSPDFAPPGGETWAQFRVRVDEAFALIAARAATTAGNLVVVTHGLVCRELVSRHATSASTVVPAHFGNTSVTILHKEPPFVLQLVNCCEHLGSANGRSSSGGLV
jgi:2,3-bisphosphoglycerate-dependent phosphoglycerate mutase